MLRVTCIKILSFLLTLTHNALSFDIEELKNINYKVDISVTPMRRKELDIPAMHIISRGGQEFQCLLPELLEEDTVEKAGNEKQIDIIKLLKPMMDGPCLYKIKDWWIYEFCYGEQIKQFHIEDGTVIGPIIILGIYDSEFDWNNETAKGKFKDGKQRYHSQFYTSGTTCDLTGKPRTTEVRFYCDEDGWDYIFGIDEPGTCSYIITLHTPRLCSHPLLKPSSLTKAHLISCHPLLNDEQYLRYLKNLKHT